MRRQEEAEWKQSDRRLIKEERQKRKKEEKLKKWLNQALHVWSCPLPCIPGRGHILCSLTPTIPALLTWFGLLAPLCCQDWSTSGGREGRAMKRVFRTPENTVSVSICEAVWKCVNSSCVLDGACRIFQRETEGKKELFQGWNSWLWWSPGYSWRTSSSTLVLFFSSFALLPSLFYSTQGLGTDQSHCCPDHVSTVPSTPTFFFIFPNDLIWLLLQSMPWLCSKNCRIFYQMYQMTHEPVPFHRPGVKHPILDDFTQKCQFCQSSL